MLEQNEIKKIIEDLDTKTDNKIDIQKIQRNLLEILKPKNISFCDFYESLIYELEELLFKMTNLITKNNFLSTNNESLIFLYKTLDIFFAFPRCCIDEEAKKIFSENRLYEFFQHFINILIRIKETYKNNNDNTINFKINQFSEYIYDSIKILLDINLKYGIELVFDKKNISLLEKPYLRVIFYDAFQKVRANNENDFNSLIKEKSFLIIDIFKNLNSKCDSNNIIPKIEEIKKISKIIKDNINVIRDNFFYLIKKILDLYSKELEIEYNNLFLFFFNEIIFKEKIDINKKVQFNKEFLIFLYDIYNYLFSSKKNDLIEIFLTMFYKSINYIEKENEKGKIFIKFKWLIKETDYYNVIIKTFPEVFNKNIFLFYSSCLMSLLDNKIKEGNNRNEFLPKLDFIMFFQDFEKYLNNKIYKKEDFIIFITHHLATFMEINENASKVILQKCNAFDIIIKLVETESEYNVKLKLLDFINKILSVNNDKIEYFLSDNILDKFDDISIKINIILIGKEFNDIKFNEKLMHLIELMKKLYDEKKINEFLQVINLIFTIIIEYKFKKINIISDDIILHLNNILIQMSSFFANSPKDKNNEKIIEEYVLKFLNSIFYFIYRLNMKIFEYKSKNDKKKPIYYTKRIIEKKIIKNILNNLLLTKTNATVKKKTFDYLMNFSIDEKNNLIISSYILYIMVKIYYKDKNYYNLQKMFQKLLNLIKNFELNSKILLNYDFISIAVDILQEIYLKDIKDNDAEECYKSAFSFLEEICKYLNQELLMKFLNKLLVIFSKNVLSQIRKIDNSERQPSNEPKGSSNSLSKVLFDEKISFGSYNSKDNGRVNVGNNNNMGVGLEDEVNEEIDLNERDKNNSCFANEVENKPRVCYDLFKLLNKYLKLNYGKNLDFINNNTSNYIILSNKTFPNHLINNMLFIDDLYYNKDKDSYIDIRIILKINTNKNLSHFILLQLIDNDENKNKIIFKVDKNILEIKEEGINHIKTLCIFNDFDKIFPADNKYHDCIISFNTDEKSIKMLIDNKKLTQNIKNYNLFNFNCFSLIIGFKNKYVDEETNDINLKFSNNLLNNKDDTPPPNGNSSTFIYISYLLIFNSLMGNLDLVNALKKEKNYSPNGSILSRCFRAKNKNWAKYIIAENDFQNKNINIVYSDEIKKSKLIDINKYIFKNNSLFVNKFIPIIQTSNAFNENARTASLYMLSRNSNIHEYYSLNHFCELEHINKLNISSRIFDNYDIIFNFCNKYVFDFLIGFLFIIEKRFDELKNKEEDENKVNKDTLITLYEDNSLIDEDTIIEYILEIFDIMVHIPSKNIRNHFLKGDSKSNILKIKYFFYKNINLLNDNDLLLEKIIKIFSLEEDNVQEFLDDSQIILEILNEIFLNPIFFGKLSYNNQNFILSYSYNFLKNKGGSKLKCNESLYNTLINLVKIIIYNKLKTEQLKEGKTQINYIINSINLIIQSSHNSDYEKKIKIYLRRICEISTNFSNEIKEHINHEFYENYKYFFAKYFHLECEEDLDNKIDKLSDNINNFISLIIKNKKIISIFTDEFNSIDCYFCNYLEDIFDIRKKFIYDELIYNKLYKRYFRNYYLNFGSNSDIFGKTKYAWFLSFKESHEKMQNKLFLKEDNITCYTYENPKSKKITNYFSYNYGKEKYIKTFKELYFLSFIDKICSHKHLIAINSLKADNNMFNCLIINKLHKIFSTIILTNDTIYIYYNICLDENNKFNIVKKQPTHSIWTRNKEDFEKELKEYIIMNQNEIMEEIFQIEINKDKNERKNKSKYQFNYNRSYKFSKKEILLNKINEIHKKCHLHIPNALEIFLNNGDNYFIVLNPENRDILFEKIINKINELYKDKKNKMEIYKNLKKNPNKENYFYMRHSPILSFNQEGENFLKNQKRKGSVSNSDFNDYKIIIDGSILKDEIANEWSKNKITNYDYLMLLNTLSGRSLKDFSQYFIIPWILQDFNTNVFNWFDDKIYRDLSLPIHACGEDKERINYKYELLDDEKYHSGTFYSTHSFICYYLVRLRPFTEIHLEIQGAKFDAPTRMFNGAEQLSNISEKYQELIPALYNLPELYIKTNYIFEDDEKNMSEPISEYELPAWSKNDPRKLTLIFRKMLESDKISKRLNLWIDLIFGYKQKGLSAVKSLNVYRAACYFFEKNELEKLSKDNELEAYLYEKEEMGFVGKQLFTKSSHKIKDINLENKNKKIFFNDKDKIDNLFIQKIKNLSYNKLLKNIKNNKDKDNKNNKNTSASFDFKVYDIIFGCTSPLYRKSKNIYYQGGISSLASIMNSLGELHRKNTDNINMIKDLLEKDKNFILLNKNYKYLSKLNLFITYDKKTIELISISKTDSLSFLYFIDEIGDISCLTTNEKGTKLFIGFTNGQINEYKIIKVFREDKEIYFYNPNYISPIASIELNELSSLEYKNILLTEEALNNCINQNINNFGIFLKKTKANYFSDNNPHIPTKINILSLNEYHNVLIALDESNLLYIISLNNNYKLMNVSHFLLKANLKMKDIIPFAWNGDFIIYSSYSVNLFNINGIPLCELNLFEKKYSKLYSITCCQAVFLYDIILFTAHKDGNINIWKIKNKNIQENTEEKISYAFNSKKRILEEYSYGYNTKNKQYNQAKITQYELQREFEKIRTINYKDEAKNYFNFMKMSNDLDYMILFDNKKNLYIMTNKKENIYKKSKTKGICYNCNKKLVKKEIEPIEMNFACKTEVINMDKININLLDLKNDNNFEKNEKNFENNICDECKKRLEHSENFLYDY